MEAAAEAKKYRNCNAEFFDIADIFQNEKN